MKYLSLLTRLAFAGFAITGQSQAADLNVQGAIPPQDGYIYFIANMNGKEGKRLLFNSSFSISRYGSQSEYATNDLGQDALLNEGSGKKRRVKLATSLNWKVGNYHLPPTVVIQDDLGLISKFTGVSYDGAVGLNVFRHSMVKLDFDKLIVSVSKEREKPPFKEKLALKWDKDKPIVDLEINGEQVSFVVNTGSNAVISLQTALFQKLIDNRIIIEEEAGGNGVASAAEIKSLRRGWFQNGMLMGKKLAGMSVMEKASGSSELCLHWLRLFNCEFDLEQSEFRYELRAAPSPPINWQSVLGAIFEFVEGRTKIWAVTPGSASDEAGIKKGDEILSFGETPAANLDVEVVSKIVADSVDKSISCKIKSADNVTKVCTIKLGKAETFWTH